MIKRIAWLAFRFLLGMAVSSVAFTGLVAMAALPTMFAPGSLHLWHALLIVPAGAVIFGLIFLVCVGFGLMLMIGEFNND